MRGRASGLLTHGAASLLRVRWMVRAPIWLYRARLGALLGSRLLMLEHTGRSSGLPRYVVLEVVDHPDPLRYVVVSGFGERAQWFRNVRADPRVRVQVGSRRPVAAEAVLLDPTAASEALSRYAAAHPRAWSALRPVLEETVGARIDKHGSEHGGAHEDALPVIALDLADR